jgi:hypothetical protein
MKKDGEHQIGFTAQMFEGKGLPEGLTGEMTDGTKYLNYERITAILWEQNRELLGRIEKLEAVAGN